MYQYCKKLLIQKNPQTVEYKSGISRLSRNLNPAPESKYKCLSFDKRVLGLMSVHTLQHKLHVNLADKSKHKVPKPENIQATVVQIYSYNKDKNETYN